jgi:hypothetical protein
VSQRAVIHPAMIFDPSGMVCVLVKVLRRNVVMLTTDHAAKAAEIALNHIRRDALIRIGFGVIDAVRLEGSVQRIPMSGFVGIKGGGLGSNASGDLDAFGLGFDDEGQRAATAFAKG